MLDFLLVVGWQCLLDFCCWFDESFDVCIGCSVALLFVDYSDRICVLGFLHLDVTLGLLI